MKITKTTTVEISIDQITKLLTQLVEKKTGEKCLSVVFDEASHSFMATCEPAVAETA